jgi:putative endonuclease
MKYFVYIVRCEDGYLDTGLTGNLPQRLSQHKSGLSRPTKNRGEITLAFVQSFNSIHDAARREKEIKGWKREKKETLIACSEERSKTKEACSEERIDEERP